MSKRRRRKNKQLIMTTCVVCTCCGRAFQIQIWDKSSNAREITRWVTTTLCQRCLEELLDVSSACLGRMWMSESDDDN